MFIWTKIICTASQHWPKLWEKGRTCLHTHPSLQNNAIASSSQASKHTYINSSIRAAKTRIERLRRATRSSKDPPNEMRPLECICRTRKPHHRSTEESKQIDPNRRAVERVHLPLPTIVSSNFEWLTWTRRWVTTERCTHTQSKKTLKKKKSPKTRNTATSKRKRPHTYTSAYTRKRGSCVSF